MTVKEALNYSKSYLIDITDEADREAEIIVSYLADENGDPAVNANGDELSGGLLIIDSAQLPGVLASTVAGPLVTSLIMQADMGLSDAVYSTVTQLFSIQASGKDGKAKENLQTITYEYPISQMCQDDKDYFYRMIPMKSVVDEITAAATALN